MKTYLKRIYEPARADDGTRILVDRVWPRGIKKQDAHIDIWAKDLAPSTRLRTWLHEDPSARIGEFEKTYRRELAQKSEVIEDLIPRGGEVTLVTAVKDTTHSHIPTLQKFLERY